MSGTLETSNDTAHKLVTKSQINLWVKSFSTALSKFQFQFECRDPAVLTSLSLDEVDSPEKSQPALPLADLCGYSRARLALLGLP